MELKDTIKKFNIINTKLMAEEEHVNLAKNVAKIITETFNYIDYNYLYNKLLTTKVYLGHIPNRHTEAIYVYDDDCLIIDEKEDLNHISERVLYECVHAVQDKRNKKGKLLRLGHITFSTLNEYSIAINETAVQFIVSKTLEKERLNTNSFGINVNTFYTNKYALACNILEQLAFVIGEGQLVKSTIYATDDFIIDGYDRLGVSVTGDIQKNMDKILFAEEEINTLKANISETNKTEQLERINQNIDLIKNVYMNSQKSIFTVYFDRLYTKIRNLLELTYYKVKLEDYKNLIGINETTQQNSMIQYYEHYCEKKYEELKLKEAEIRRSNNLALTVVSNNRIEKMFRKIREFASKLISRTEY